jgi:hypothetical protein
VRIHLRHGITAQVIINDNPPEIRTLKQRKFDGMENIVLLKEVISRNASADAECFYRS